MRCYLLVIFNDCLQILNCLNGARAAQSYQPHPSFATIAQTHYVEACRHNSCTKRHQNDVCQYYIKDTNCWYYLSNRSNKTIASSSPICIQASDQSFIWKKNIGMLPRHVHSIVHLDANSLQSLLELFVVYSLIPIKIHPVIRRFHPIMLPKSIIPHLAYGSSIPSVDLTSPFSHIHTTHMTPFTQRPIHFSRRTMKSTKFAPSYLPLL